MEIESNMKAYTLEFEVAKQLAEEAAKAILGIYYGELEKSIKADGTPVTNADVLANKIILEGLRKNFPADGIISEEMAEVPGNGSSRTWYIDPIDGTKGFVNRSDHFSIHIGMTEGNQPVLGIVHKPTTGEYYYGIKGQGAYLHVPTGLERRLQVSQKDKIILSLSKDFLLCEFGKEFLSRMPPYRTLVNGGEGLRIMRIAEGIANLHLPYDPTHCHTWDVCAPQAIAEEAGACVRYLNGEPITYHGQKELGKYFVVASNPKLAEDAARVVREITPFF